MDNKKETVEEDVNNFATILIALIVFVVTCVIFIFYKRRTASKRGILLTGLCDSGKTLIFSQLIHGKYVGTHTSMKENVGDFIVNNGVLQLIDVPGYERLRPKYFDQYKSSARGVMYVVDSVTIQQDIRDTAEFLYNILLDPVVISNISALLVVCNKQDLSLAKSTTLIKSMLEKELNALRVTKFNQLESVDQKGPKKIFLGKEGKDFTFSSLPIKVDFVEASAATSETAELEKWLISVC